MGHNRGGDNRRARLKRHRRETARLSEASRQSKQEGTGVVAKVKEMAQHVAHAVGDLVSGKGKKGSAPKSRGKTKKGTD